MFVTVGLIQNKLLLVQVMAWHQTGAKPLPEPMKTKCYAMSIHKYTMI